MANGKIIALTATSERPALTSSGYAMLIVLLLAILADVYGIQRLGSYGRRLGDCRSLSRRRSSSSSSCPVSTCSSPTRRPRSPCSANIAAPTARPGFAGPGRGLPRRRCRCAPATSSPTRSRSTTCAATRSKWRRRSCGAWSIPPRRCSTSTITSIRPRPGRGGDADHRLALPL